VKIVFNPVSKLSELTVPMPKPAKAFLPEWYKNIKSFDSSSIEFNEKGQANKTIKMCAPFADSMVSGYIQESWQDIYITTTKEKNNTIVSYNFPTDPPIMSIRSNFTNVHTDNSFYSMDFVWHPQWTPQMPEGYSALYISPLNRFDLPFHTLSGIVDHDSFIESETNASLPFLLKSDFVGLIKKGTPLYQIIPIKRDSWESSSTSFDEERNIKETYKQRQYFWGGYKKTHWTKKEYN
jgi:hypothetical protein